ncbi:MAG: bifunctional demethylmenaquinone methyltransferase/2-methoxy-6-polyprenyl-1,4-benzoquinol methylase UbiE [Bacteroidales bacterium]|nr:bifunctional demethylmenaquinone methyltransferase/2-methoxy-6-polyprenyl-1,4-benzoquinol methylase UbiE [Bacteroidales bacterium]
MEDPRKNQTTGLFNNISATYDFVNRLMTFRMDKLWRKKTIAQLKPYCPYKILDVATGTGDLALAACKLNPQQVIGIDLAEKMLEIAKQKVVQKGVSDRVSFQTGDAESIPFPDESFDAVTIAFGIRNFANLEKAFKEIIRVLKPGGIASILETSRPRRFPLKQLYKFYFTSILPFLGKAIAKDKYAYKYFADTVMTFPQRDDLLIKLNAAGFSKSFYKPVSFGTVTIYIAIK